MFQYLAIVIIVVKIQLTKMHAVTLRTNNKDTTSDKVDMILEAAFFFQIFPYHKYRWNRYNLCFLSYLNAFEYTQLGLPVTWMYPGSLFSLHLTKHKHSVHHVGTGTSIMCNGMGAFI